MEVLKIREHLAALANLVHHRVMGSHKIAPRLVVGADAVHDARERALREVIAHKVIKLRGDDTQTVLADLNGAIQIGRELHAAFIQSIRSGHDASSKSHAASEVVLHIAEHFFYTIINGARRPTIAAPALTYGAAVTPAL